MDTKLRVTIYYILYVKYHGKTKHVNCELTMFYKSYLAMKPLNAIW